MDLFDNSLTIVTQSGLQGLRREFRILLCFVNLFALFSLLVFLFKNQK